MKSRSETIRMSPEEWRSFNGVGKKVPIIELGEPTIIKAGNLTATLLLGDVRETLATLPDESVHCCVTSPPYFGLRSYLPDGVRLKVDAPEWVRAKLAELGISPVDGTAG